MATYVTDIPNWADAPYNGGGSSPGHAIAGGAGSCYDNGGDASATMVYSLEMNNGSNGNCPLSFRFQAGD